MRQTLHIFRKDVRHLWPYAAVVLTLTAALAYLDSESTPFYGAWSASGMAEWIRLVLPLAWWFTIAAAVHGEAPAGDRQFWVTRPYSWKSVVAAKVLFVLVFLMAPFLVSDCIILAAKGFPPSGLVPSLLWRECTVGALLMLPAFLLAVITRGMREFVLGVFLLAVTAAGIIQLSQPYVTNPMLNEMALASHTGLLWKALGWALGLLQAAALPALTTWQYARRRTVTVRALFVALIVWVLLPSPWLSIASTLAPKQPAAAAYPEVTVRFASDRGMLVPNGTEGGQAKIQVDVPVEVTGRDRELLECEVASVTVVPQHGAPWRCDRNPDVNARRHWEKEWIEMHFEGPLLERLSAGPVTLRATLAVAIYQPQGSVKFRPGSGWHSIPGFGAVSVMDSGQGRALFRRMPFGEGLVKWSYTIERPGTGILRKAADANWYRSVSILSPVVEFVCLGDGPDLYGRELLPDTIIVFNVARPIALVQRDLTIPNIRLSDYVVPAR